MSGRLKCAIDRLYSAAYPVGPKKLKKVAILLSAGVSDIFEGALYSYENDFLGYLGLEDRGAFTAPGNVSADKLEEIKVFGKVYDEKEIEADKYL